MSDNTLPLSDALNIAIQFIPQSMLHNAHASKAQRREHIKRLIEIAREIQYEVSRSAKTAQ